MILVTFKRLCADARPIGPGAHVGAGHGRPALAAAGGGSGWGCGRFGGFTFRQTFKVTIVKDRNNKA